MQAHETTPVTATPLKLKTWSRPLADNTMHDNDGHHKTEVRSLWSESARLIAQTSKDTRNASQQPHDFVTMNANTSGINHDILPQKGCNDDSDIFEGVILTNVMRDITSRV